jgi:four helix bundle protein
MAHTPIEQLEVFRLYEEVATWSWDQVQRWSPYARKVVGEQLVRAADSVGANLVEGDGRYGVADGLRFFIIARASARETRLWIDRACKRGLVSADEACEQQEKIKMATVMLNNLIAYRRSARFTVSEELATYNAAFVSEEQPS